MNNNITILTAGKQAGKTTFLTLWSKGRKDVDGILTPVLNGQRHFYNIADGSDFKMESLMQEDSLAVGNYRFSVKAFEQASKMLLEKSKNRSVNTLIIDEIGPLEIEQRKGLYAVFCELLKSQSHQALLIVVRPSLIEKVSALLKTYDKDVNVIQLNELNAIQGKNS